MARLPLAGLVVVGATGCASVTPKHSLPVRPPDWSLARADADQVGVVLVYGAFPDALVLDHPLTLSGRLVYFGQAGVFAGSVAGLVIIVTGGDFYSALSVLGVGMGMYGVAPALLPPSRATIKAIHNVQKLDLNGPFLKEFGMRMESAGMKAFLVPETVDPGHAPLPDFLHDVPPVVRRAYGLHGAPPWPPFPEAASRMPAPFGGEQSDPVLVEVFLAEVGRWTIHAESFFRKRVALMEPYAAAAVRITRFVGEEAVTSAGVIEVRGGPIASMRAAPDDDYLHATKGLATDLAAMVLLGMGIILPEDMEAEVRARDLHPSRQAPAFRILPEPKRRPRERRKRSPSDESTLPTGEAP